MKNLFLCAAVLLSAVVTNVRAARITEMDAAISNNSEFSSQKGSESPGSDFVMRYQDAFASIDKAPSNLDTLQFVITPLNSLYNGKPQVPSVQMVNPVVGASVVYSTDGTNWFVADSCPFIDVVDTKVSVKISSEGYNDSIVNNVGLTITPRNVVLTSASESRAYDSYPLSNPNVIVSGDGFAAGEGAEYVNTSSQTDIGQSVNKFTYTLKEGTKPSNYVISTSYGTLRVTYISTTPVKIAIDTLIKLYDGIPLEATYSYQGTLGNDEVVLDLSSTTLTDAGQVSIIAFSTKIMRGDIDVTQGYVLDSVKPGLLLINPRVINMASMDSTKLFDAQPLMADSIIETGDGWIGSDGAIYAVTSSQTKVGANTNYFTYVLKDGTKPANYNISCTYGTLTVLNPIVPVIEPMYEKWNIILNVRQFEDSLSAYGVHATINEEKVTWYVVNPGADISTQSKLLANSVPANPSTGLFHTEDKIMDGTYFVAIFVPEATSIMGVTNFISKPIVMDASKAPAYLLDKQEEVSHMQGYNLLGQPVPDSYRGIIIYPNGDKKNQ